MNGNRPINVTKILLPSLKDYTSYLEMIWESGQITNSGLLCKKLEISIAEYLGVTNLNLVANGTLALQLSIKAFNLAGEIITTPYSYVATTNAILWEGCKAVFVDIDERTFCIDPDKIEEKITDKTSAILATHVYGNPCDVLKIQKIADKYGLKVIYDAAHAFGVRFNGKSLLDYGDCSTLSFHATKLFHTAEGGAVVCKDYNLYKRISLMKKFGHEGEEHYQDLGINAKISELHAAIGLCILPKVNNIIALRKKISGWYDDFLKDLDLQRLEPKNGVDYNYAYYPIFLPSHDDLLRVRVALMNENVFPRRYFYPSLNTLAFLDKKNIQHCPVSERIAKIALCLPLYDELKFEEVEKICSVIKSSIDGRCSAGLL